MQNVRRIKHNGLTDIPHARFMQRTECARQQARCDKNQQHARPLEKLAQIDFHAAFVNQIADYGGSNQAQHCAKRHFCGGRLVKHCNQEKHAFQAFARHG